MVNEFWSRPADITSTTGLVLPAIDRFANPDPLARTYQEVQGLAEMIVRWQKGLTLRPRPWLPENQVGGE